MDEYDLDTTNLAGLDDHRDRLIALAEQCAQHDLAATLTIPTNLMEIPGLDERELDEPLSPLFFPLYDVACCFRAHEHAIKVLAECLQATKGSVGLADATHETLEHATDNLPEVATQQPRTARSRPVCDCRSSDQRTRKRRTRLASQIAGAP
jgi:hypothetical protein